MKMGLPYEEIRKAALALSRTSESERNTFLDALSRELVKSTNRIISANKRDVSIATKNKLPRAFVERLVLDAKGIKHLALKLHDVRKLKSGLGETIEKKNERDGLILLKVRVPLGVLAVIYEARPEVTLDVAALCIKSGNAAILKGGTEALRTNTALYECIKSALQKSGLPAHAVTFIATGDRSVTDELLKRHDAVDLLIARGGYGMVKAVMEKANMPVLAHASGGARIYVDKSADLKMAENIIVNAKITKPAACNSVDTALIHESIAKKFIPTLVEALKRKGVSVIGDSASMKFADIKKATDKDWYTEFLGLTIGIKVVRGVDEAVSFTNEHSKRHTEGIVAKDKKVIQTFLNSIDAAALFVNASTRLNDGYVFGLGSEMGISTGKLHARGPVGLKELTTYKWVVFGHGNIRE